MTAIRAITAATVGLCALASLAACGNSTDSASGGAIPVEASDTTCKVSTTTASAGNVTFNVTNKGSKVTEFYLYGSGDQIIGEVENITPGLSRKLIVSVKDTGKYQTACKPGMVGHGIRGDFTVTGGNGKPVDADAQSKAAVASYVSYVSNNVSQLTAGTEKFVAAVKAGNVAEAKKLYAPTRMFYERIEPVAEKFSDLDASIDFREADIEPGQKWTGFHYLEKELWKTGLKPDAGAMADKLLADVKTLGTKVKTLNLTVLDLSNGAKSLLDEVATGKVTGEEETFSHTDLWDFQANVDGSQAAIGPIRPLVQKKNPGLLKEVDAQFDAVDKLLAKYQKGEGYLYYNQLTKAQIKELATAVDALSEPLSKVSEAVKS